MSTTVKMLREHLCREQRQPMTRVESALHGYLIALCDVLRPLGPDGKHGDRHTALCGCDDGVSTPCGDRCDGRRCALPIGHDGAHDDGGGITWDATTAHVDVLPPLPAATREPDRFLVVGAPGSGTKGHQVGDEVTVVPLAEPIPPADRHAILAEMTRDETAEGLRADGFPPAATASGLGDALREMAELRRLDATPSPSALDDLADRADALEAERDRLTDKRDTLRAALDQERRSMANRLAVLERIKGERDVARAAVGRVRALVDSIDDDGSIRMLTTTVVRQALDGPQDARGCPETGASPTGVVPGGVGAAGAGEGDSRHCWRGCWCRGQR